jgi:hypothetical protein
VISKVNRILPVLMVGIGISVAAAGYAQEVKTRREAYGAERAGQVETLLHALFPNDKVEWDPVLAIRQGSGTLMPVDLGNFVATRHEDGSTSGVTALEVGTAKARHLEKIKKFQSSDGSVFSTTMVAFRTPASGQPLEIKKVPLDPYDPLTRITWFEVKSWPAGGWPVLRLRYESYTASRDALTVLEWESLLDMATSSFLGRIPTGILTLRKGGEPMEEMFSTRRISSTEVEIVGGATKKVISYPCGDPCVVDGPTFLARWSQ